MDLCSYSTYEYLHGRYHMDVYINLMSQWWCVWFKHTQVGTELGVRIHDFIRVHF